MLLPLSYVDLHEGFNAYTANKKKKKGKTKQYVLVLIHLGSFHEIPQTQGLQTTNISHCSGVWEVQDHGPCRFGVW